MTMLNPNVGDIAVRVMGYPDGIEMKLKISEITEDAIVCGPWTFDRATGAEIDEGLGWGPQFGITGSFLRRIEPCRSTTGAR